MLRTILISMTVLLGGCVTESVKLKGKGGTSWYKVEQAISGDLILVNGVGKVKYIGVDAPGKSLTGKTTESFYEESRAKNRALVEGKFVRLEFDKKEENQRGQLLAYVFVQKDYWSQIFVNGEMLRTGMARYEESTINTKYQSRLLHLESRARAKRTGIWSLPQSK